VSWDGTLKVWDLDNGQLVRTLQGQLSWVTGVAVTGDARGAVSISLDRTLRVWDLDSGQLVHTLQGHTDRVTGVAVTGDARWAVSASLDKTLRVWDLTAGLTVAMLETHAKLECCAVASDRLILAGDRAGALHILDWHPPGRPSSPALPSRTAPRRPSSPTRPPISLPAPHPPAPTPIPFRRHLSHEDITALHATAVELHLASSRTALLAGIAPAYADSLPTDPSPSKQLSLDLEAMNQVEKLADGTVPLRLWLSTALRLTSVHSESAVFQRALDRIASQPPGNSVVAPAVEPTPASRTHREE
jgi:Effector-associated domain 5/WD domain, G-beta repeat